MRMTLPPALGSTALAWDTASHPPIPSESAISWLALLLAACGLIAGLYFFLRGFLLLRQKKWIEDTPVTNIAAAAMGQTKVWGKATGPYTLLSPLAGVDCYYYRAIAWNGRDAQGDRQSAARATETLFTPFFVEDDSGRLMIDPRGARLDLPAEYDEQIGSGSATECSRRFLRRHGLSTQESTDVSEYAIKPGDSLLVVGTLAEASGDQTGFVSFEASDLQRREQFEAIGAPIDRDFSPAQAESDFDIHPPVSLRKGKSPQIFLLSRQNPERIIDDLARRSVLGIWGGAAMALCSLWLLLKWTRLW